MGTQLPSRKGHSSPPLSANAYCGQTAGYMSIPLGTEIGLGPGDIVLDGDPAPQRKGTRHLPLFGPCLLCQTVTQLSNCSALVGIQIEHDEY